MYFSQISPPPVNTAGMAALAIVQPVIKTSADSFLHQSQTPSSYSSETNEKTNKQEKTKSKVTSNAEVHYVHAVKGLRAGIVN